MNHGDLIESFCGYVLQNPTVDVRRLFNTFITRYPSELSFLEDNFLLFIQTGESIRNAPPEVAALIHG